MIKYTSPVPHSEYLAHWLLQELSKNLHNCPPAVRDLRTNCWHSAFMDPNLPLVCRN